MCNDFFISFCLFFSPLIFANALLYYYATDIYSFIIVTFTSIINYDNKKRDRLINFILQQKIILNFFLFLETAFERDT